MTPNRHKGFISTILLIVIGLFILQFGFNIDVLGWIRSPQINSIVNYIQKLISILWNTFIESPARWIWNTLIVGFFWKYVVILWGFLTHWVDSNS